MSSPHSQFFRVTELGSLDRCVPEVACGLCRLPPGIPNHIPIHSHRAAQQGPVSQLVQYCCDCLGLGFGLEPAFGGLAVSRVPRVTASRCSRECGRHSAPCPLHRAGDGSRRQLPSLNLNRCLRLALKAGGFRWFTRRMRRAFHGRRADVPASVLSLAPSLQFRRLFRRLFRRPVVAPRQHPRIRQRGPTAMTRR